MNGNTVSRHTIHGKDEAYRCSRSKRHAGCTAGRIARHAVETAVLDSLKDFVLVPENLEAIHNLALESQAEFQTKRAERTASLIAERTKVASRIANITKAIADHGHSKALLESLSAFEAQRAQINLELKDLAIPLASPLQPLPEKPPRAQPGTLPPHSQEHFAAVSQGFLNLLKYGNQEQIKTFLQGYIHKITAERKDKEIHGTITYYYPPLFEEEQPPPFESAPTSGTMLPTSSAPVGAPTYRQQFTIPFTYQKRPR